MRWKLRKNGNYYLFSLAGSFDFLSELRNKLKIQFSSLSLQLNKHGKIYEMTASEQKTLYQLYSFMYHRASIFMKRKNKIFTEFAKKFQIKNQLV